MKLSSTNILIHPLLCLFQFLYSPVKFSTYSKIILTFRFYPFYLNFRNGISVLDPLNVLYGINCWIKFDTDPNHSRFLFFPEKLNSQNSSSAHINVRISACGFYILIRKYINTYTISFKEEKYSRSFEKKIALNIL